MKAIFDLFLVFKGFLALSKTDVTCNIKEDGLIAPTIEFLEIVYSHIDKDAGGDGLTDFERVVFGWVQKNSTQSIDSDCFNKYVKRWIEKFYFQLEVHPKVEPQCDHTAHIFNAFAKENYRRFWTQMLQERSIITIVLFIFH